MFQLLKNIFRPNATKSEVKLDFSFFLNDTHKEFFEQNGYLVIKSVVDESAITHIISAYELLSKHEDFYEADGFITSANYGKAAQELVHKELSEAIKGIIPKLFDTNKIYYNLLNVLVLKFNKDKKEFFPHQDVPYVDESLGCTIFAWIPTEDINEKNGSILVLPKSHKNFRWQRTHDQSFSPLKNLHDEFLKRMIPVYLNKGDLLLFDNSLIHASSPNSTDKIRIALNTGIASRKNPLIHYRLISKSPKYIEKFNIDEDFWLSGDYITPDIVPDKYGKPIREKIRRTRYFTLHEFNKILK